MYITLTLYTNTTITNQYFYSYNYAHFTGRWVNMGDYKVYINIFNLHNMYHKYINIFNLHIYHDKHINIFIYVMIISIYTLYRTMGEHG